MAEVLKKPYEVTVKLQYGDLTPGYFYRKWTGLKGILERNGSLLATEMGLSMEVRESSLINPLVLAAILVDVLHAELLNDYQVAEGKQVVINIALKLAGIQTEESAENNLNIDDDELVRDPDSDEEMSATRPPRPRSQSSMNRSRSVSSLSTAESGPGDAVPGEHDDDDARKLIEDAINVIISCREDFSTQARAQGLKIQAIIKKMYPPVIKDVCFILVSLPVTQVSVERLFSSLKLLKSDLRNRLKSDIVDDMLFLRNNVFDM